MVYTFATFAFDDAALELTREGRRVALEPQPARALARLLASAGDLVTRDELRAAVWGGDTHVDYDRGLAYCIGQVRTALGDSGDNPRFVQTLPKRGFRFLAPVASTSGAVDPAAATAPAEPTPPAREAARAWSPALLPLAALTVVLALAGGAWWWVTARAAAPITVAVSIFDNETGDPRYDAFVHGLSDVVVTHLTGLTLGRAGIIGNAAPLRQPRAIRNLKTLAATLDASHLIVGQLQRQGDDLRVIVHFIRLTDGVHLSAQRFVRPPAEVARFEADVVGEAERAVLAAVAPPSGS